MEYKNNISDIKKKLEYVKERLRRNISIEEREKLEMSLVAYLGIINSSGTIAETRIGNFLDQITHGRYSENKYKKYSCLSNESLISDFIGKDYLDADYLQFLLDLASNVSKPYQDFSFNKMSFSEEQLTALALDFYHSLENEEIEKMIQKMLNDKSSINVTSHVRNGNENFRGLTFYDFIFNQPYCTTILKGDIEDATTFTHELMHGVDFYMNPKLYSKNYYGFHETAPKTIDYLFCDYLQSKCVSPQETEKLKQQSKAYVGGLANRALYALRRKLKNNYQSINPNELLPNEVLSVIDIDILKDLLEVESCLISYGLYQQIRSDKQYGMNHLVSFMKMDIPKNKTPDFTNFGLDSNTLLQLSQSLYDEQVVHITK